jgi:membrane fusion protein (multidrug efflux system)
MGKRHVIIGLIALAAAGAFGLQATGQWTTAYGWLARTVPGLSAPEQPAGAKAKDAKAGGAGGGGAGRGPAPVEVAEARSQTLQDSISVIGSLAARESVTIASDTAGRIVAVSTTDGAAVKGGDELFRLDGALLAAEVKDAEARLALARTNHERNQSLVKSRTVPQSALDQTEAELNLAQSAVELVREKQNRLVVRAPRRALEPWSPLGSRRA